MGYSVYLQVTRETYVLGRFPAETKVMRPNTCLPLETRGSWEVVVYSA